MLATMGWRPQNIIDLGGLDKCRGAEMYLPLWLSLYRTLGTGHFNIAIQR